MTTCIEPTDPRYFTVTSDGLYDRHTYNLILSNGQHEHYETWEEVQVRWFNTPGQFLSHVEILDKKKGFGV